MSRRNRRKDKWFTTAHARENFIVKMKGFKDYLGTIPRGTVLEITLLSLILIIAVVIRILPLRWGFFLSEFDPYQQYRLAEYIVNHGFHDYFTWHDDMSWYPWGRETVTTNFAGLSFTAAVLYNFIRSIGVNISLYDLCVIFPVLFGAVSCVIIYFLAREVWGKTAGLFSALFLALSASHISRTGLGFFDDETIGILTIMLISLFFLRAISSERPYRATLIYSLLSGLGVVYLAASWGAFRYLIGLLGLFTFILIILKKSSPKLLMTYSITLGVGYGLMGQMPRLGYAFFTELLTIACLAIFFLLVGVEGFKRLPNKKLGLPFLGIALIIIAVISMIVWSGGYFTPLAGKFQTILNPSTRFEMPLVESVAEHRPATWATFFYEFGAYIFLGLFGFYFLTRRFQVKDLFIIVFGVTSIYFAASFVRLTLILAPALLILSSIAIVELCKPSIDVIKEIGILPKKKVALPSRVGKEFGVAIFLVILIIISPTFYYSVRGAYTPTTLATSSIPVAPTGDDANRYQDWPNTLVWMKENLPEDSVIFSWWDYGYWITTIGDKRSLADNGTINSTQIKVIACAFLSNETQALPILKRYDVSHIAVFVTWTQDESGGIKFYGYGEDNKWYWMARIGNGTTVNGIKYNFYQKIIDQNTIFHRILSINNTIISNNTITDPNGLNDVTMLGKLIQVGINPDSQSSDYFKNIFSSPNKYVFLYEVQYLEKPLVDFQLDKTSMSFGEEVTAEGQLFDKNDVGLKDRIISIESSMNRGETWINIVDVPTEVNGTFRVSWEMNVGSYLIRAKWPGETGKYLEAISEVKSLNVTVAEIEITCQISEPQIKLGSPISITGILSKRLNEGNITIQYSVTGEDWEYLDRGKIVNGTFTTVWTPPAPGEYYIRSVWPGDYNHYPATSESRILIVED